MDDRTKDVLGQSSSDTTCGTQTSQDVLCSGCCDAKVAGAYYACEANGDVTFLSFDNGNQCDGQVKYSVKISPGDCAPNVDNTLGLKFSCAYQEGAIKSSNSSMPRPAAVV